MPEASLTKLLEAVRGACRDTGISALDPQMAAIEASFSGDNAVEVAVLGQFKAGKSSLLNSLIGRELLPVGVVPVTAIVTKVRHGDEAAAFVVKLDGTREAIPLEALAVYISEAANPGNMKRADTVEVTVPFPEALRRLVLIDTPGLGSIHRHNSEATRRFLPNAGYAIYLTSAERPIGEADRELIAEAVRYCGGVAVVITKIDILAIDQLSELAAYITAQLAHTVANPLPLFYYSIRQGAAGHREAITRQFLMPLGEHSDTAWAAVRLRKCMVLAENCLDYLGIALRAAEELQENRDTLAKTVTDETASFALTRKDIQMIMTGCLGETRPFVEKQLFRDRERIVAALLRSFDEESPSWKGNLYAMTRRFEAWLKGCLAGEIAVAAAREQEPLQEKVRDASRHFERYVRAFRDRLDTQLLETLSVKLPPQAFDLRNEGPVTPDISVSRVFDTPVDLWWFLFPMALFRSVFLRWYRGQITDEVEKNLHRAVSDITEIINKRIERFAWQSYEFIVEESTTLQRLTKSEVSNAQSIHAHLKTIRNATRYMNAGQ